MEDASHILTLKAASIRAEKVLAIEHNGNRYMPPPNDYAAVEVWSRETTPTTNTGNEEREDFCSQLRLSFDLLPKDIQRGFVFGSNPASCDVLLERAGGPVSRQHFCITFDDQERVVLKDTSSSNTIVSYDGHAATQQRHHFTWILFPGYDIRVKISGGLEFRIELPEHHSCRHEYSQRVRSYLEKSRNAIGPLDLLNIHSLQSTAAPTEPVSPRQHPIYIMGNELGRGNFGRVYKAKNVSTGEIYAAKLFKENLWKREVEIMKGLSHRFLVQFVDFTDEVTPCLVMEYLYLGNLQEQHEQVAKITNQEAVTMLNQLLHALDHLHSRGIVHRDIKPLNILVRSRGYWQEPSQFWVKLGDFGLAKDSPLLTTFCGTQPYLAPEVRPGSYYTPVVDIWALGVVIFQYIYGLPRQDIPFIRKNWYRKLITKVEDWDSEDLLDFLSFSMLKMDPQKRLSARACLQEASKLRVATPTVWNLENNLGIPTKVVTPVQREAVPNLDGPDPPEEARDCIESHPMLFGEFFQSPTQIQNPPTIRAGEDSRNSARSEAETIRHSCTSTSKHSFRDHVQAPTEIQNRQLLRQRTDGLDLGNISNTNPSDDAREQAVHPPSRRAGNRFLQIFPAAYPVSIRLADFYVNATQICKEARVTPLTAQIRKSEVPFEIVRGGRHSGTYVEFEFGLQLCQRYRLNKLESLLRQTAEGYGYNCRPITQQAPQPKARTNGFFQVLVDSKPVSVREIDFRVNATQLFNIAGKKRQNLETIRKHGKIPFDVVRGAPSIQGTYVEFAYGLELCQQHGLSELQRLLQATYEEYKRKAIMTAQRSVQTPVPALEHNSRSVGPSPLSSQLDGSLHDSVRAEDSELEESEHSGYAEGAQEAQEQEDVTHSEGGGHSEEHESPNCQHLSSWASRHTTAKTTGGASSSCVPIDRFDQRSGLTEASFERGSFLRPVSGSFLSPFHPGLLHEHQSSPSPHYGSVPRLWGA